MTPEVYTTILDRIESLHLAVLTLKDAGFARMADEVEALIGQQTDSLAFRLAQLAADSDNYHAETVWQALGKYAYQGKGLERLRSLHYTVKKLQPEPVPEAAPVGDDVPAQS